MNSVLLIIIVPSTFHIHIFVTIFRIFIYDLIIIKLINKFILVYINLSIFLLVIHPWAEALVYITWWSSKVVRSVYLPEIKEYESLV